MDELLLGLIGLACAATFTLLPLIMSLFVFPARLRALDHRVSQLEHALDEALRQRPAALAAHPEAREAQAPPHAQRAARPAAEATPPQPELSTPANAPAAPSEAVTTTESPAEAPTPALPSEPAEPAEPAEPVDAGPPPTAPPPRPAPAPPRPPVSPERLAVLFGGAIGALLVLIGAFLGLKTVAERGLLSPGVRVGGALVVGTLLWVAAPQVRKRAPWLGSALAGTAAGVLYGTIFAATTLYGFLDPSASFALTALITAVAALHATRTGEATLAYAALLGGLLAPIVLSTGENRPVPYFVYLGLLSIGLLLPAWRRGWSHLVLATAAGVALELFGWTVSVYAPDQAVYGMTGAWCLALPFVALHANTTQPALRAASLAGAALLTALAMPWLLPIDPVQFDLVSGQFLPPRPGVGLWWAALTTAWLAAPLWLVARLRGDGSTATTAAGLALLGTLVFATWLAMPDVTLLPAAVGALGALAAGAAITWRHPSSAPLAAQPLLAGAALAVGVGTLGTAEATLGLATVALAGLGALPHQAASQRATTLLGTAGAALALTLVSHEDGAVTWAFVPAAAGLLLLGQLPVWRYRAGAPTAEILIAALAPVLLYPAFHVTWRETLGAGTLGAVPALLAAQSLAAFALVMRRARLPAESLELGVWIVVVLAGLTAALPLQLSAQWLTIGIALEGAALAWLTDRARHPVVWTASLAAGLAVSVRLLLNPATLSYGDASGWPLFNWTLYTWGVPALCLAASAVGLRRTERDDATPARKAAPPTLLLLAVLVAFALLNVEISHAFRDAGPLGLLGDGWAEGMVRSLSWGAYGMLLITVGMRRHLRALRLLGFAFLMLGALKVFLVDLWSLSGFARVGSLLGLGGTLMLAAYLFERLDLRGAAPPEERP